MRNNYRDLCFNKIFLENQLLWFYYNTNIKKIQDFFTFWRKKVLDKLRHMVYNIGELRRGVIFETKSVPWEVTL